jgi:DNA helicase-2/ATP-dependent DNA helicase PcrA
VDPSAFAPAGSDELVARLEPSQRAAVMADEPVVCVLAGAGTGKTRVLTLRVARRVDDGSALPSHVLVCTFSRKAAAELRDRLRLLGVSGRVDAGTLHRTALKLIVRHREDRRRPAPSVLADRRGFLARLAQAPAPARPRGGSPMDRAAAARLDAEIGWAKARLVRPESYEEAARRAGRRTSVSPARVAVAYARYEEARARRGLLDLDDLLVHAVELLEGDETFARGARWWHRHLFVDEAQDLNEAQFRLLSRLAGDEPDLFVVGDPDQSVYGWNGADPAILERLSREFASTRVLHLRANHRCSPQIVRVALAALGTSSSLPVSGRPDGPLPRVVSLPTDDEEARWVARQVWLAHRPGRRWSSIAVLARTNAQLTRLAAALEEEHVPWRLAGADLAPASDVRTGAPDPKDADGDGHRAAPGRAATASAPGVLAASLGPTPADPGPPHSEARPPTPHARPTHVAPGGDAVVVSTFHRAKGLQWPTVFVAGLADGLVPLVSSRTRAAREEERRLLYVALTRAEDEVTCTWSLQPDERAADARQPPRRPSPWLGEIEAAIAREHDEVRSADPAAVAEHLARIRSLLPAGDAEGA